MNENESNSATTDTFSASDAASRAWEATKEKSGEALQTGERYVWENPRTSVLSIFGLGFVLGLLVGWSLAHEERDDYSTSARKFAKRWGHKLNLD